MYRTICFALILCLPGTACDRPVDSSNTQSRGDAAGQDEADSVAETQAAKNREHARNKAEGQVAKEIVSRKELDAYMQPFRDGSKTTAWHYGERTEGELEGTWICEDGSRHKIEFGPGDRFSEEFAGSMTTGNFAISDQGKIVAVSKRDGVTLGSHYTLRDGKIEGPKGPSPNVTWKRIAASR